MKTPTGKLMSMRNKNFNKGDKMKRHSSKILALGVVCLAFLFILSSLFGCKLATVGQSEPEFRTIQFQYDGNVFYPIKVPGFMPDFTQFERELHFAANGFLILVNYYISDSNDEDHYRFICSGLEEDVPGVIGLMLWVGDKSRQWIYDENDEPYEVVLNDFIVWLEAWVAGKHEGMHGSFEEEKNKDRKI